MNTVIENAPTNQFARKVYFWKELNRLRLESGLRSRADYKSFSARQLEQSFIDLSRRQIQQRIAREATVKQQYRREQVTRQQSQQ